MTLMWCGAVFPAFVNASQRARADLSIRCGDERNTLISAAVGGFNGLARTAP